MLPSTPKRWTREDIQKRYYLICNKEHPVYFRVFAFLLVIGSVRTFPEVARQLDIAPRCTVDSNGTVNIANPPGCEVQLSGFPMIDLFTLPRMGILIMAFICNASIALVAMFAISTIGYARVVLLMQPQEVQIRWQKLRHPSIVINNNKET